MGGGGRRELNGAGIVVGHRNQPRVVYADRSLLVQDVPVEVVVANPGGGGFGWPITAPASGSWSSSIPNGVSLGAAREWSAK